MKRVVQHSPFTLAGLIALCAILTALAPSASASSARMRSGLAPTPGAGAFGYQNYAAPNGYPKYPAGEPSIGDNWNTGNVLYQGSLQTSRVAFSDANSPTTDPAATATWTDVSALQTSLLSLDSILFTDHTTGRTFVTQLGGATSFAAFTGNDGAAYTSSVIAPTNDVDHETVGGGPFAPPLSVISATAPYTHAVYYCSQGVADAGCELSPDGGLTFGPTVKMYDITQCNGLHGHVKVAPDGTVYVPNKNCGGKQAVAVSTNDNTTWNVYTVPDSASPTTTGSWDPSVGVGLNSVGNPAGANAITNTVYFGYDDNSGHPKIAVSHDEGKTWDQSVDVGATFGIQNTAFPAVVAGDDNRAAFAFLGSATGGNGGVADPTQFTGIWHLYIATTTDSGKTWTTVDATPNDPVQRGPICSQGTTCMGSANTRNLLDFMDETVDKYGRVLVGYADGCITACDTGGDAGTNANSYSAYPTIARQIAGARLFARYDPSGAGTGTGGTTPTATPEPGSGVLYGTGAVALLASVALWRRRAALRRGLGSLRSHRVTL